MSSKYFTFFNNECAMANTHPLLLLQITKREWAKKTSTKRDIIYSNTTTIS